MGPNYFISMGNLKIMTRAHECLDMNASDIISVHDYAVSINLYVFWFDVCTCKCMSIRLPVHEHSCKLSVHAFVCVRASVRTYVFIGPMCGSCILAVGPGPTSPDKNPGSAHGSTWLSIHPLKIVKLPIKEISVFGRSVN